MTAAYCALSRASDTNTAIEEVVATLKLAVRGRNTEGSFAQAYNGVFFVSSHHAAAFPSLGAELSRRLGFPLIGCSAAHVTDRCGDAEGRPGLGVLLLSSPDDAHARLLDIEPFSVSHLDSEGSKHGVELSARLGARSEDWLLVFPDAYVGSLAPFMTPLLSHRVFGGAPSERGLGRVWQWGPEGRALSGGACGWVVRRNKQLDVRVDVAVAQGCAPVGPAFVVTEANGPVIMALDGRPALEVFIERLPAPLRMQLPRALRTVSVTTDVGSNFVAHQIIGLEADHQGLVCAQKVNVGTKVRFAIRESLSAREDMRKQLELLAEKLRGRRAVFGLYFDAIGRGQSLYGHADIDASLIDGVLGEFPWLGMSSSAEIATWLGEARLLSFSGVLGVVSVPA